ncbi:restriction endonuclease subunit S [Lactobacillus johnsonii]|uniref:restriction endonuclease subunit S n=1 Tax=Lactobacillus johnsonii TaxID=33959 RepID=UPI0020CF5AB5|nr:restriction endonuclease subunit S [Lactobacillus johnsonii]
MLVWEQRKLKNLVDFYSGLTYHPENIREKGTFVIRSSNIKDGQLVTGDNIFVAPEIVNSTYVKKDDIIVVVRNGSRKLIGKHTKLNFNLNNAVIGAFMTGIRSNNNNFINAIFDSDNFKREIHKNLGATINQITTGELKRMNFYIPSLTSEQNYLGNLMKVLDKLITLQQRKLKLLKLMKNIVSYNLVVSHKLASNNEIKWKAVYLKDIARIYQPTTITKKDLLPKGIPVFGANDYIGFYNKYNHETDQVTICARGASAGHPNYVKGPVWITGNSMVINVDETYINKKFLYTLLTFTDLKRFVTGGAQPQITRENLNSLKILLPSIKAQNNLSAIIENLSINIRKVQLSINSAKRLKQFLLQNMFI